MLRSIKALWITSRKKMRVSKSFLVHKVKNSCHQQKLGRKVFCLSMQRNGTTSFGKFMLQNGFTVAGWPYAKFYDWPSLFAQQKIEAIYKNKAFQSIEVFEDNPWWGGKLYQKLATDFPDAQFVMFHRSPDMWWSSMLRHSDGLTLENFDIHRSLYDLPSSFIYEISWKNTRKALLAPNEHFYKNYYIERNAQVINWFRGTNRLLTCNLDDPSKWSQVSDFLNFKLPKGFVDVKVG